MIMKSRPTLMIVLLLPMAALSQNHSVHSSNSSTLVPTPTKLQEIKSYVIGKKFEFCAEIPDAEDADRQFFSAKDKIWTGISVTISNDSTIHAQFRDQGNDIMECDVVDHSNDRVNFDEVNTQSKFPAYYDNTSQYVPYIRSMPYRLRGQDDFIKQPHDDPQSITTIDYLIPYTHVLALRQKERDRNEQSNQKTYGKYWAFIKQNKVTIGMSEDACSAAIGSPQKVYKNVSGENLIEIWEYENASFQHYGYSKLFFKDNVLYKIIKTN
jgi:hypothetical protein